MKDKKLKWTLRITEEQFDELYGDLVDKEIFRRDPENTEDLLDNFLASKLWRLNNLYTIINKKGKKIPFKMNYAQHQVYASLLKHPRLIILKSRQQGISTFYLIYELDDSLIWPDFSCGLMAQGLSESSTLLKRIKTAWNNLDDDIKNFLCVSITRDNKGEISFSNNSSIYIRTSFRSDTLHRLHISEYGKIANKFPERAKETKTGTLQTIQPGNIVAIESTAEGKNDFSYMWDQAIIAEIKAKKSGAYAPLDFKPVFLSWVHDPDCMSDVYEEPNKEHIEYFKKIEKELDLTLTIQQRNFWISKLRELKDDIYQEYPATPEEAFMKSLEGSYYSKDFTEYVVKKNRVTSPLYDPNIEVNVAMDLGVRASDLYTLLFFQRYNDEWRIINEHTNFGKGLRYYIEYIKDTQYKINWIICPHDIKVFEMGADGGKGATRLHTIRMLAKEILNTKKILPLDRSSIEDGIEAVRQIIPNIKIDSKCEYLIKCFYNYSKEWDEHNNTWKDKPNHNEWSHGADAIRYMAMSKVKREPKEYTNTPRSYGRGVPGLADGIAF